MFKALGELIRLEVLTRNQLQQVQVCAKSAGCAQWLIDSQLDLYALRSELPRSLSGDDCKTLNHLLDEVITSASDRCKEVCALDVDSCGIDRRSFRRRRSCLTNKLSRRCSKRQAITTSLRDDTRSSLRFERFFVVFAQSRPTCTAVRASRVALACFRAIGYHGNIHYR